MHTRSQHLEFWLNIWPHFLNSEFHIWAERHQPSRYLIGVVWTGDQQEDPGEGVLGGVGNLPGLGAWEQDGKDT